MFRRTMNGQTVIFGGNSQAALTPSVPNFSCQYVFHSESTLSTTACCSCCCRFCNVIHLAICKNWRKQHWAAKSFRSFKLNCNVSSSCLSYQAPQLQTSCLEDRNSFCFKSVNDVWNLGQIESESVSNFSEMETLINKQYAGESKLKEIALRMSESDLLLAPHSMWLSPHPARCGW